MPLISFVLKWLPFWCWMLRAVVVWMSVTYMDFQTLAYSGTAGALRTLLGQPAANHRLMTFAAVVLWHTATFKPVAANLQGRKCCLARPSHCGVPQPWHSKLANFRSMFCAQGEMLGKIHLLVSCASKIYLRKSQGLRGSDVLLLPQLIPHNSSMNVIFYM